MTMNTLYNVFDDNLTLAANKINLCKCLKDFYFGSHNNYFFHRLVQRISLIKGKRELKSFINKIISVIDID